MRPYRKKCHCVGHLLRGGISRVQDSFGYWDLNIKWNLRFLDEKESVSYKYLETTDVTTFSHKGALPDRERRQLYLNHLSNTKAV